MSHIYGINNKMEKLFANVNTKMQVFPAEPPERD